MESGRGPLDIRRLGRIAYADGLALQERLVDERKRGLISDTLLILEHTPVVTLGRNARTENLLVSEERLLSQGVELFEAGRGGDVTYHGPGQVVGYPIVEIPEGRRDVHRYVRELEEVMIRVCADYGFAARRIAGKSGTFVGDNKIGAIGVRISRWVTSHGFAFNVNTNLSGFDLIVPCGLRDQGVTSLAKLLGAEVDQTEVEDRLISRFLEIMDYPARRGRDQTPVASR
ncbi:MAG: lipoyl(octanoyl) transferase LipB [Vicinamibacteria bacterium]|jgi:lipoyl(octanoyl) transferase|nr:lipoyl(octanoyl) transferase LipB [Vicinamibacteria bacterium]MBP9946523.1 lipoyl(octanoyl) transferase LipB [Vicinamibacteria bacterium]